MRRPRWPARVRLRPAVLYVCIPAHNEAATVGVLLWRLRTVLGETGRDYEVVVYDDGSTDDTAEVLAPYKRVLPLTVLGGGPARGRSAATEALVRHVASHSRYPRRDACVVMQGDFSDRPEDLPAFLTAFDAGADVVVGRRPADAAQTTGERRLRRMGPWAVRPLVRVEDVDDLLGAFRLYRVAVLRDLVRSRGDSAIVEAAGWAGVVELLVAAVPFARRIDAVDAPGRYDVRPRPSRIDWAAELRGLARYAWRVRGTHARLGAPRPERPATPQPGAGPDAARTADGAPTATAPVARGAARAGAESRPPHPATAADAPTRAERPRRAERKQRPAPAPGDAEQRPAQQHGATNEPVASPSADAATTEDVSRVSRRERRPRADRAAEPGTQPQPVTAPPAEQGSPHPRVRDEGRPVVASGVSPEVDGSAARTDGAEPDDGAVDDVGAPAPRRKKRRRRRSRDGAVLDAATSDASVTADTPGPTDGPGRATGDGAAGDGAAGDGAAGDAADGDEDDRPAGDPETDDAGSRPAGRRRKRRRSRSGKRGSGVAPGAEADVDHTDDRPADAGRDDAPAAAPPLDRSSLPA